MAIWESTDNWLLGISNSDHTNHSIKNGSGALTVEAIQKAFDVSYGAGKFNVRNHGTVITVFSVMPLITKLQKSVERAKARNDAEALQFSTAMLEKYQRQIAGDPS